MIRVWFLLVLATLSCAQGDERNFDEDYTHIDSDEFKREPVQVRIEYYRAMLAHAETLETDRPPNLENQAAYVATQLVRALLELDEVMEALRELRHHRGQWTACDANWQASLSLREARALAQVGVLDQAELLFELAVRKVDAARDLPEFNVGGYFNAHIASIEHKLHVMRGAEALAELNRFEAGLDWDQVEAKFEPERVQRTRARLLLVRAQALAAVGTDESREEALTTVQELHESQGASPYQLFAADASLMSLRLEENPRADVRDLYHRMKANLGRHPKHGIWERLVLATARVRAAGASEADAALAGLRATVADYLDFVRKTPLPGGVAASRFGQYRAATEVLFEASSNDELVQSVLELQSVGRLWEALGRPKPSVREVTDLLCSDDSGVLVYVRGKLQDRWIVLDHEARASVYVVPRLDEAYSTTTDFQVLLEISPDQTPPGRRRLRPSLFKELGGELARRLFPADLRARLADWSLVYLVGREDLYGLSVEALPLSGDVPFGCTHAVVDLPSLPIAPALMRRASAGGKARKVRIVADSRVPESVAKRHDIDADLQLTPASLRAALGLGAESPRFFLHDRANRGALQTTPEETHLHVIVHGVRDPYRELSILLAMTPDAGAPDGLIGVEAIRRIDCAPVVLLSVCSGADAPLRCGDAGANHLGGAFIEAGAHSVVLSPGEVRLDANLTSHRAFYQARREGASTAEAVRAARAALRDDPSFSDPFHWGQTRVFGIGR